MISSFWKALSVPPFGTDFEIVAAVVYVIMSENSKGLRSTVFLRNDGQMVWPQQYRTWHTIVKPPRTTNSCHCPDPSQRHVRADPLSVRAQRLAANRKKHSIAVNR